LSEVRFSRSAKAGMIEPMRFVSVALVVLALAHGVAFAQDACETKCNQASSECLKQCVGESKDAAKKESAGKMMECLKVCDEKAKPCREACRQPAQPPVREK
jgi:hypothetical protein